MTVENVQRPPGAVSLALLSLLVLLSPVAVLYLLAGVLPLFDFNDILWMNLAKHVAYRLIIGVLLFVTLLDIIRKGKGNPLLRSGLEIPLGLYLFSILNSLVWSSFILAVPWIEKTAAVLTICLLVCYLYTVLYWLDTPGRVRRATGIFLMSGFALSLLALLQKAAGVNSLFRPYPRLAGVFWDSNIFARYEVVLLAFSASILVIAKPKGRAKAFYVLFAVVSLLCLLLSLSRSGYVAFLVIVSVLLLMTVPKRYFLVTVSSVVLLALAGYLFLTVYRTSDTGNLVVESSAVNRIVLIAAGAGMIKDHWLAGVGFGNYPVALERVYAGSSMFFSEAYRYATGMTTVIHNWVIEVWAEQGIIGLAAFIVLFGVALRNLLWCRKRCADPWYRAYLTGYFLTILVFLVHGFFYHTFITQFFFWVLFSMAVAAERVARRHPGPLTRPRA